jgi:hypothetical protein
MNGKSRGLLLAAAFFCASVPASATTLTIINPSFELPVDTGGTLSGGATGWNVVGPNTDSGVWNINKFPLDSWDVPVQQVLGEQVAYLAGPFTSSSGSQGGLFQPLGCGNDCNYDPNLQYTLTGVVGFPEPTSSTLSPSRMYTFSLLAGSTVLRSVSGSEPVRTLVDFTLSIPAGWSPQLKGQQLTIRLLSSGAEAAVDNLVLQAAPVPEPGSVALLTIGIGLLGFRLRRCDARK